jgi:hypothetical protein
MTAFNSAILLNAYDIIPTKGTLVDTSRSDPDVSICIPDGKVPAGRGRHPVAIDAIHDLYEFISWMKKVRSRIHLLPRNIFAKFREVKVLIVNSSWIPLRILRI